MENSLNTTSSGGTQTSTQNPQAATSDSNLTSSQGNLQSGQVNLFSSTTGSSISLAPSSLSAVNLQSGSTSQSLLTTQKVKQHHVNGVLLGIVVVLFVMAMLIFWRTTLAAKSTTD